MPCLVIEGDLYKLSRGVDKQPYLTGGDPARFEKYSNIELFKKNNHVLGITSDIFGYPDVMVRLW